MTRELNATSERDIAPENRGRMNPWKGNDKLMSQQFMEDIDGMINLKDEYKKI
jgi:hypothetical protein